IAIGLAMVHSRRLLGRFTRVERLAPAIAVASAVIVLGLGVALTWRAASGVGVLAQAGVVETAASPALPASAQTKPRAAGFSPGAVRVLYQVLDAQGMYQLFSVPAAGGEPRMLTQTPFGIWNYAIAPDGQTVVYAALRADRGSDLWAMDAEGGSQRLLLACPEAACRNVTFAPDGGRLVYERLDISPENVDGAATLWSLDVAGGETAPVFQDASLPGFSPAWSPDGRWLSYISPGMPTRIQLYDLTSGRGFDFVTLTSMRVVWEPAGRALLLTDVDPASLREGQQALTHLLRFDVDTEALVDISGRADVSDSWPAWSADGEWVAFVRRVFADGQPERGNQVWVMRADGREARQVTAAENALHQNPVWSADGRFLLYHRYNLAEPLAKPAVWLLDVTSGDAREVVNPGSQPAWLAGAEP
ncbi:MAG: PD40 domain-containing protein, partial [Anaerolineales bacterium]|nr:PD40 domain-containing protein [Anaerolineales bacterium]